MRKMHYFYEKIVKSQNAANP